MKILITSYFVLPSTGGLWTYVDQLKQGLRSRGHEVNILAHHPDFYHYYMPESGLFFKKQKVSELVRKKLKDTYDLYNIKVEPYIEMMDIERYIYKEAVKFFSLEEYDVIHAQDIISTQAIADVKPKETPLITTIHGCYTRELLLQGVIKNLNTVRGQYSQTMEYYGVTLSDAVIVPSEWMRNIFLSDFNLSPNFFTVIPNGMDTDLFLKRSTESLTMIPPEGKKVIACIARLDKLKGHSILFEALYKLKKERTDWVCWLIGDGILREELVQLSKSLQLEQQIMFLGNRKDVPALLKRADLCVLPSLQENCPFSVMEAQLAGRALVVSDAGGLPEMVKHNETGLISPVGQSEPLFINIKKVLEDDSLRQRLAENGRQWAIRRWSLNRMLENILAVYEKILKRT